MTVAPPKCAVAEPARGPLRVSADNPRYFTDGSGKAVLLVGSHVWNNLVDMGPTDPPPAFDWDAYLDFLTKRQHNFIRLWTWELTAWDTSANNRGRTDVHFVSPHPWLRTGPGEALDGKPRFDLTKLNDAYFQRLHSRVGSAAERGVYVSVMLFEGWGLQRLSQGFRTHPMNPKNNVNGVDADANGDGVGVEVHELGNAQVTQIQEAYVRRVIDTVNEFDNVLYEISNENHPDSTEFQYHFIDFIHRYEKDKPKQHPVGMTFQFKGGNNQTLLDSPAEWISPNPDGGYRDNPPAAKGTKVIVTDTDHLWGIGGNQQWVWKSFFRGLNPIFMDPYDGVVLCEPFDPKFDPVRRSMGLARSLSLKVDLASLTPQPSLASTRYCLANPGREYLVYQPKGGESVTLNLAAGRYTCEWMDAATGKIQTAADLEADGAPVSLTSPFEGEAVVWVAGRRETGKAEK